MASRPPVPAALAKRIAASAALLALLACSPDPAQQTGDSASTQAETSEKERWVRRILPFDPTWRPESVVPAEPQKSPGMVIWEVSNFAPDTPPTAEQRSAADDLVERCYQAAVKNGWLDFAKGLSDGYELLYKDRRHYANWEFIRDGRVFDPERPEFLMYYGTPQGKKLAGFMFYPDTALDRGPQLGGPLTIWHWHVWNQTGCLVEGLLNVGIADENGRCERGTPTNRSPEMVHVWLIDHPDGPFSTNMSIEPAAFQKMVAKRRAERGAPW